MLIKVTLENYPNLYNALSLVYVDSAGISGIPFFEIPSTYSDAELSAMDNKLPALTEDDLETFCQGETTDMEAVIKKYGIEDISLFLNDFWENFQPNPMPYREEIIKRSTARAIADGVIEDPVIVQKRIEEYNKSRSWQITSGDIFLNDDIIDHIYLVDDSMEPTMEDKFHSIMTQMNEVIETYELNDSDVMKVTLSFSFLKKKE
jgi:hypothetical protein